MDKDKLEKLRERNKKAIKLLEKWEQEPALMTQGEWDKFYADLVQQKQQRVLEFTIEPPSQWSSSKMWAGICHLNEHATSRIVVAGFHKEDCIRIAKETAESFGCIYKKRKRL